MKQLITTILPLFVAFSVLAQAPQAFNYQGVARNLAGSPLPNRIIRLRVSILSGSPTGSAVYKETHQATTTDIGLFNLQIGKGALVLGSFSAIDWGSNPHFVQIEMDENGGSNYQLVGTSQLLSVPYALYSNNGSQWNNNASGINYNNGNVGIGSGSPTFARLNIVGKTVGLNDGERLFYGTVPDAPNDFIAITNGASENGYFNPLIFGAKHGAHDGTALLLMGSIAQSTDNGSNPVMQFNARINYLPDASQFSKAVKTRPIFQWANLHTPLMTMLPNGNLGIGATSPTAILHTVGSVRFQGLPAASHANALVVDNSGNLATRAFSSPSDITLNCTNSNYLTKLTGTNSIGCSQIFDNGSFVGIGTSSATQGILLSVNGNIQATGITTLSDKRFKTKTALLSNALSVILHLNPISFTWRQGNKENLLFDDKEHFGLIAQELEKEIPNLVYTSEDGTKSVNYTEMIPVLIKAIQEQQIEIETLKKELRETNGRKKRK